MSLYLPMCSYICVCVCVNMPVCATLTVQVGEWTNLCSSYYLYICVCIYSGPYVIELLSECIYMTYIHLWVCVYVFAMCMC